MPQILRLGDVLGLRVLQQDALPVRKRVADDEDAAVDREAQDGTVVVREERRKVRATAEQAHPQWALGDQHAMTSIPRRMASAAIVAHSCSPDRSHASVVWRKAIPAASAKCASRNVSPTMTEALRSR